jgi:drug/metabolite transporter (DMT)-like permease
VTPKQTLLLLGHAFWWGAAYVFAALALRGFTPVLLVALRLAIAALVLAVLLQVLGDGIGDAVRLLRARPGAVVILAVTVSAAPFSLITSGQDYIPAGTTAVLISSVPLWAALLGVRMDRSQRVGARQAVGLALGFLGVALVVGAETVQTGEEVLGAGLVLLGAAAVAVGNFYSQSRFSDEPPMTRATLTAGLAAVVLAPGAAASGSVDVAVTPVAGLIGLGVGSTALLLVLTFWLIDAVGPRRAALSAYLAPAFALLLSAIVLDERITVAAVGGLVLIVSGVVLAARPAPPRPEGIAPAAAVTPRA